MTKKKPAQLDREIGEVLAKRVPARPKLSRELAAMLAAMVEDAEVNGAENLGLARREEGYTGDPKEFRFSPLFARRLPDYVHTLLVDDIDEYRRRPHDRLGRPLTEREAEQLQKEAVRILEEERAYLRSRGIS